MSSHYILIFVQKSDAWVPGCTRNPETYILKDQVPILFVSHFLLFKGLQKNTLKLVARKYARTILVIMPTNNCCIYEQKKNIGIAVERKIKHFILRNRVNYKRNLRGNSAKKQQKLYDPNCFLLFSNIQETLSMFFQLYTPVEVPPDGTSSKNSCRLCWSQTLLC